MKHQLSYQWRLFLPLATILCIVFGLIIYYQYKREADYRAQIFGSELEMINNRILNAYDEDVNLRTFLNFIQKFFKGSVFEGVRVSVYFDGQLQYSLGTPIPIDNDGLTLRGYGLDNSPTEGSERKIIAGRTVGSDEDGNCYLFSKTKSSDGRVTVRTAMPYSDNVHDAIDVDTTVWLVIIGCLLTTLLVTYYFTSILSRNVVLLKDFAYRATTGGRFSGEDKFPRNELGEISREIIKLYRERLKAMELIKKERKIAINAIEEKVKITRQLTNNINHEIKTPVGIIRGYLESIIAAPEMDTATRNRFLDRMLMNVERLTDLLNDVSTMTRLENGADMIAVEKIDMHDLVYQIESDLPANNLSGNLEFSFDIPFECNVSGNYNLIQGMICGLIRNAALHSGGTEIGLRMISENKRFYVFSFYDNGNGVSSEHIPHLFERFYRVDTGRSRKMGGTGLGLPIVKSTIISLGGTISVHNRSTGGLEFIFTLPKWTEEN
ncbi:sensor histidine kinase [Duncaniella muris]|jgi:signal transduction histidine kinase|uniref:sensor histidine kinase n=1 Tax=Duncaniella muris TaxID=2094150 RepID=UPI0026773247|nr:ATP-binding protein [Duncaniella muris]